MDPSEEIVNALSSDASRVPNAYLQNFSEVNVGRFRNAKANISFDRKLNLTTPDAWASIRVK